MQYSKFKLNFGSKYLPVKHKVKSVIPEIRPIFKGHTEMMFKSRLL